MAGLKVYEWVFIFAIGATIGGLTGYTTQGWPGPVSALLTLIHCAVAAVHLQYVEEE